MSAPDHRTRARHTAPRGVRRRAHGALAGVAMGSYVGPALAGSRPGLLPGSPAPIWPSLRHALGVEDRTAGGRGCALTFDDGPHPQGTPAVLEALALAPGGPAHATFFLVGEQVRRDPALVGEILSAGHEVALHCDRHRNLLRLAPAQVRADIDRAQATIEDLSGRPVVLYRPPYGVLNAAALRLARARRWRTLLWSHWGVDWQARATPETIAARVTRDVGEGSVLLLHDADDYSAPGSWRRTAAALPRVLEALAQRGLQLTLP